MNKHYSLTSLSMKKIERILMLLVFVTAQAMSVSCSKDDDDNGSSSFNNQQVTISDDGKPPMAVFSLLLMTKLSTLTISSTKLKKDIWLSLAMIKLVSMGWLR